MTGFIRTLRQYWETPKGRHDIVDYAGALSCIVMTAVFIIAILEMFLLE